jgi:precorrin-2/cobalt-factor-2 C20-methyltransferase
MTTITTTTITTTTIERLVRARSGKPERNQMNESAVLLGVLYGVGVGPGDPELITCKAARILAEADWIMYPSGARSGTSLARRIVEPLGLPTNKFREVSLGMSRDRQRDQDTYRRVVHEIAGELRRGKSVAWITEGDPLFYSTFVYLHEEMRCQYPLVKIEIVPGVTSVSAAAARAGVPVSRLDEKVAVIPAVYGLERLPALMVDFDTVFLVKVSSVFDQLLARIDQLSAPIEAVYVEKVGTREELIVSDLRGLKGKELSYFSLVILQKVMRVEASNEGKRA